MELALSVSLGRGDSAATVSRHVRQYLQEPDRLFRRVRDEKGNLKLSKRAAAYHPGRGEYRSSYKNAMRLARTETNMAYRAADNERRQQHPWIIGVEVKRSKHKFPCKICERLTGRYPKDFKFVGWHPQCRCYTTDVLAGENEIIAYRRAMLNGEDVSNWQFSGEITKPHDGFSQWIDENQERIGRAAERDTLPYWIKDNPKYVKTDTSSTGPGAKMDERNTINEARRKYQTYDEEWEKAYFNEENGGYNVYHRSHQFSGTKAAGAKMSGGEAEKHVGRTLADVGAKQVEFLPENGKGTGKPDLAFDGLTWDVKYISMANENTIRSYYKDARKAQAVIFYSEAKRDKDVITAVNRERGRLIVLGRNLSELPTVYVMNEDGKLRSL